LGAPSDLKKAKKSPGHQVLTHRDPIPRLWDPTIAKERGSHRKYKSVY
jgi:hypothetical protein